MKYQPHGRHLIAGSWIDGQSHFESSPADGQSSRFSVGTVDGVDEAARQAEVAFAEFASTRRNQRAAFLSAIADEIESRADLITDIGTRETGLPEARLIGERGRTSGQLRLFAEHILKGEYLDRRHQAALPDRKPLPGPDLKLVQRPIGPVAVFGASNFPLAFSTAGGDTAAALAAGCPVVVKGHSAHPGTSEIVAEAILAAIESQSMPAGVFSLIQGGSRDVGTALVKHSAIKAVGFTGSLAGGRALFDLCASREHPIPFFGELGSVNPMFLMPAAMQVRGAEIGAGWAGSLTMGAGQFCTNPGIAVGLRDNLPAFTDSVLNALSEQQSQLMLTDGIAQAYQSGVDRVSQIDGVEILLAGGCDGRSGSAMLARTHVSDWLVNKTLGEEVFGPFGLIIEVDSIDQMHQLANEFDGQLTFTLQMNDEDNDQVRKLLPILEQRAGRLLINGFPTGVEVSDAMVHGGPYPASTNFGATSVGTMSIRRFLRPVCYQNFPEHLVPDWSD